MAGPADRDTPTVVVSRRAVTGREREFERWLRKLASRASDAHGHVRSEVQPPTDVHPDEWVIVYQFVDGSSLRDWLDSPERERLVADGRELMVGVEREQIVALASERDPVTAVASFRVKTGHEDRYAELYDRLVDRLSGFDGYLRCELFEPVEGVQDDTVVVFSFDTREHLDAWLGSDERRDMLTEIDELIEERPLVNVVGGFGGWFGRPGMAEVKRWKQASVVLLALFPTALLLGWLRQWLLPDLPFVWSVLFGNVLGVIILSWLLMPVLTRLLDGWLRS